MFNYLESKEEKEKVETVEDGSPRFETKEQFLEAVENYFGKQMSSGDDMVEIDDQTMEILANHTLEFLEILGESADEGEPLTLLAAIDENEFVKYTISKQVLNEKQYEAEVLDLQNKIKEEANEQ